MKQWQIKPASEGAMRSYLNKELAFELQAEYVPMGINVRNDFGMEFKLTPIVQTSRLKEVLLSLLHKFQRFVF